MIVKHGLVLSPRYEKRDDKYPGHTAGAMARFVIVFLKQK